MARHYTEEEILARIDTLTRPRLTAWVRARIIRPLRSDSGDLYREVDLARLSLLTELDEGYRLDDEAMGLVMSLLDQVHALRAEMSALMGAVAAEPEDVRHRLRELIANRRG